MKLTRTPILFLPIILLVAGCSKTNSTRTINIFGVELGSSNEIAVKSASLAFDGKTMNCGETNVYDFEGEPLSDSGKWEYSYSYNFTRRKITSINIECSDGTNADKDKARKWVIENFGGAGKNSEDEKSYFVENDDIMISYVEDDPYPVLIIFRLKN